LTRSFAFLFLAACALQAAPVPIYRPKPPVEVTSGRYTLLWFDERVEVELESGGVWRAQWSLDTQWQGTWQWNSVTRTLRIKESALNGSSYPTTWSIQLNHDLSRATGSYEPSTLAVGSPIKAGLIKHMKAKR
jgi:hypothetical protein